ncbi:MAG TPA: type II toxin-antitoxin system RelE/ParE family toxin [Terriglobia bacterium]|nr:type II toxin-antitoxin system RelE/ParE family toxin [Terriglobia bacterium]
MSKKTVIWSPEARADLRAIDREPALRILRAVDTYLTTGAGDVKKLHPPRHEFRLRVGDYRVLFLPKETGTIEILRVLPRKDAYR